MAAAVVRITLYVILLITPVVLVSLLRLETHHVFVYELGKNFGLLGFTILAMQFVLSARLKWVERPFGLDILLSFHKYMAFFAVTLLFIHPTLLAMGDEGWSSLIGLDAPYYIWLARAALTILVIHGFVSVLRLSLRLEFERWRRLHNILAFSVLVLGFFHSWNAGHDLSAVPMQFLWGSLLGLAVLTYLYHRGLRPLWHRRHAYRVIDVLKETHNVWSIKLVPPEGRKCYAYFPGQFHFLTLYRGRGLPLEEHPFTISSSPTQEGFVISTIKASGDFTALIGQTNPGDQAAVHGPFGRFSYVLHPDERDLVFIAGGIGITLRIVSGVRKESTCVCRLQWS